MWTLARRTIVAVIAAAVLALISSVPTAMAVPAQTTPPFTPDPTPTPTATPTPIPTGVPAAPAPSRPPVPNQPERLAPPADPIPHPDGGALSEHAHDVMSAHADAVTEAQALLEKALADLKAAEVTVAEAVAEADAAREARAEAVLAVERAARAEQRAERQLTRVLEQIAETRDDLGTIARDAYQGGGLTTLSVVLDADTPAEYAERYIGMRTVLRAGDSALGDLAVARADLLSARERLRALRAEKENLAEDAAQALTVKEAAEATAAAAQRDLSEAAAVRLKALQAAQEARLEDYLRYQEFLAESEALGPVIVDLSELLALSSSTVFGTGEFVRPGTGDVTSPFGMRRHPITGVVKLHTGVDLSRGDGSVYAADSGTVVKAEWNRAYGYMTVIDHGRGVSTLYGHQAAMHVGPGDRVTRGTRIGVIGSTGYSTGPHLHFEVRWDGVPVDPWPLIQNAPFPPGAER